MRIRSLLFIVPASVVVVVAGCATDRDAALQQQTQSIRRGAFLLSVTNAEPGQTYELGVYVIAKGDTIAKIARDFQISIRDFMAINPGLDPLRLLVGQKVRVYERRKE
jgi:LysM repeat protein